MLLYCIYVRIHMLKWRRYYFMWNIKGSKNIVKAQIILETDVNLKIL